MYMHRHAYRRDHPIYILYLTDMVYLNYKPAAVFLEVTNNASTSFIILIKIRKFKYFSVVTDTQARMKFVFVNGTKQNEIMWISTTKCYSVEY